MNSDSTRDSQTWIGLAIIIGALTVIGFGWPDPGIIITALVVVLVGVVVATS